MVVKSFERIGFKLLEVKPFDGIKGLKDEISCLKHPLQLLYDSKQIHFKVLKKLLDMGVVWFSHHMKLFVFERQLNVSKRKEAR